MGFKREFCTRGTGLGDNHVSIPADGVGMEDIAIEKFKKKKRVKSEGTKGSRKIRTSKNIRESQFFKGQWKMSLQ